MGGGPSREEFNAVVKQNSKLREENVQIQRQLSRLQDQLGQDQRQYDNVRAFVARWSDARPTKVNFIDSAAMIGRKGIGKSTFLWMKCPGLIKPQKHYLNGTNEIVHHRENGFMDTIGINIEVIPLARLLVLFLIKGVPRTAVFCETDRVARVVNILNHFMITKYYVLAMDVNYIHRYYSSFTSFMFNPSVREAFDEFAYESWEKLNSNCLRCDAETPIPLLCLDTFEEALNNLFPSIKTKGVGLVDYASYMDPAQAGKKSIRTLAYLICKELKAFYEEFDQNELRFIDQY